VLLDVPAYTCSSIVLYATGITGFETASNYVEEMRDPGVFVTTVSWLWYGFWWCYCSHWCVVYGCG
jgi:hypothetical protein